MDEWLDSTDFANLVDIRPQNVRKAIARGHWRGHSLVVRQAADHANHGTPRWQVRLDSLPSDVQRLYRQRQARLTGAAPDPEPAEDLYIMSGDRTGRKAARDRAVRTYLDDPGVATARRLAAEHRVHISQIYRWVDKARHRPALPHIEVTGEKVALDIPRTKLAENALMRAIKYLLDHPREPLSCGHNILLNAGENISYAHFTRLLHSMSPSLSDLRGLVLGNKVGLYLERTPKIIRAWLQLPAGHTLIGDQHLLDWAAVDPHTGETVLLQLYLWVDATSRYWMGLSASFGPYSKYTIGSSLLQACTIQIPEVLYTDWGRPERSGYVNDLRARLSGYIDCGGWSEFRDKYPDQAGIERKFSTPGVPPVKPIESQMNVLTTYLKQEGLTGYRKRAINPFENKQTQGTLAQQKRDGTLPTVPELLDALARVVERHNLNQCRTEEGPSIVPAEVLWRGLAGRRRVIPEEDLKLMLYPRVERRIRNACVTITLGNHKAILTGSKLALIPPRETVAVYVNPEWPHGDSILCRHSGRDDWEPYCVVQPWEYHGVDSQDAEAQKEAMHIKQGYLKQFRDALSHIHEKGKTQAGAVETPNVIQITEATRLRKKADKLVPDTPKPIDRQAALAALADQILEKTS